jgi:hypothetical protein
MINEINANLELNFIYIILPNVIDKCYYLTYSSVCILTEFVIVIEIWSH